MPCLRKTIPFLMWLAWVWAGAGAGVGMAAAQALSWEALVAAGQSAFQAGNYEEAGEQFDAALRIAETFSELDTRLATTLNNIAAVHYVGGDYVAAEPLFRRALSIRERSLGRDHVEVATSLNNLAAVHRKQGDSTAAVPALERALVIREHALGPTHPSTLAIVANLAAVHRDLNQDAQSEALLRQSLDRRRQAGRDDAGAEADILEQLAEIQQDQGRYGEAAESLGEAIVLRQRTGADATQLEAQAAAIRDMARSTDVAAAAAPAPRVQALAGLFIAPARTGLSLEKILVPQTPIVAGMPVAAAVERIDETAKLTVAVAALPGPVNQPARERQSSMAVAPGPRLDEHIGAEHTGALGYFLQLISLESEDRVHTEWVRLQGVYADVLGGLPAGVIRADLGDHGVWYRLQAGPLTGVTP